ncbi:MAG: TylF/MycF family methyltransferase [Oscillospiraceae bacterium]|nr:TylF/MycF family methyltransferase [Oscillospiraceae bacterium]
MEIYVYGTGCGAGELADSALPPERIAAFVESEPRTASFLGRPVIPPEELARRPYELVIVTSRDAEGIAARLDALGIDPERRLFLKNNAMLSDRNRCYELAEEALGRDFTGRLQGAARLIRTPLWSQSEALPEDALSGDYVRVKTLEALCAGLGEVPGAAAELGVYRGDFARCISALLPERRLYLFDSFEGFDEAEAASSGAGFRSAHRNTSSEQALAALPHPERAVLKPGFFPGSAAGLEDERFCLVSLDVDLEESTLAGLRWFVPRMSPGSFLLLHDWLNPRLPGVKKALRRCEEELGRPLRGVPLCDVNGTLALPF